MPRFMVLIYGDEARWAASSEEWNAENGRRHRAFLDAAGSAVITGGELAKSDTTVSIRGDDAAGATSPGAFVQADKGLGGFYLLEAESFDAAVELARGIPEASTAHSGVEIRQVN